MGEDTGNPLEVAYTEWAEEGDRGMDGDREEAVGPGPVQVQEREQVQGDVGDGFADVVVEGNVQAVEVGSGHIHRVDSSRMAGDHNFHIDSGKGEVRTWQADQVAGCDNGVKGVVAEAGQCARTNNCHDGRTVYDQTVVGSEKSG
jgi:hypothetical protein